MTGLVGRQAENTKPELSLCDDFLFGGHEWKSKGYGPCEIVATGIYRPTTYVATIPYVTINTPDGLRNVPQKNVRLV